jgi:hypothetical protein
MCCQIGRIPNPRRALESLSAHSLSLRICRERGSLGGSCWSHQSRSFTAARSRPHQRATITMASVVMSRRTRGRRSGGGGWSREMPDYCRVSAKDFTSNDPGEAGSAGVLLDHRLIGHLHVDRALAVVLMMARMYGKIWSFPSLYSSSKSLRHPRYNISPPSHSLVGFAGSSSSLLLSCL